MCPMFSEAVPVNQRCPAKAFEDRDVARHCQAETFNEYNRQKLALKEKLIVQQVEKEFEERLTREKKRARDAASGDEKLRMAKEHVLEKVLTLSCPRCEQAFLDFDGCFALKCPRCTAGICAYCLADCGRDAHAHIGGCELGKQVTKWAQKNKKTVNARGGHPAGTYGSPEAFQESQRLRRLRDLASYFENKDEKFTAQVLDLLEREIKDLNIAKKDVTRAIDALKKSRNKPQKVAPVGAPPGRAAMGMNIPGADAIFGFLNLIGLDAGAEEREIQRQQEQERRALELIAQNLRNREEANKRKQRINGMFKDVAKVRDLEAKYQADRDYAIKESLNMFRNKMQQGGDNNNNNNNNNKEDQPGIPIVIDLAKSAMKPDPKAGKLRAERRAKREQEAAEAARKLAAAEKDGIIDLDLLDSQQSPPPESSTANINKKKRQRSITPNKENRRVFDTKRRSSQEVPIVLD